MSVSPSDCAHEVLDVVPLVMRTIRAQMRQHRAVDLSVPQFRTLSYIDRNSGASLSAVAEHIGLTLPSMSKIVDGLVARKLVSRQTHHDDRRRMTLALTEHGRSALTVSREATRNCLAQALGNLSSADRSTIATAMNLLRPIFTSNQIAEQEN
jgi:DNA-binding MarR family transcriptional regulator